MKKLLIVIMVILSSLINLYSDPVEPQGSGTETDPYQIANFENLLWLGFDQSMLDSHIIQTADIDCSDNGLNDVWFHSIGDWDHYIGFTYSFSGNYDGQGYTISNLEPIGRYVAGLFGGINNATISNVHLENIYVLGGYSGALVGIGTGNIINCSASGIVHGAECTGGLVGMFSDGQITNCSSTCDVVSYAGEFTWAEGLTGGLVGDCFNNNVVIQNSFYDYESVLIEDVHTIKVGALDSQTFQTWLDNGRYLNVDDYLTSVDGVYQISTADELKSLLMFGYDAYSFELTNSIDLSALTNIYFPMFTGSFNGNGHSITNLHLNYEEQAYVGLFGYTYNASFEDLVISNSTVSGKRYTGMISGRATDSTFNNCLISGELNGGYQSGGIAGYGRDLDLFNCQVNIVLDAGSYSGALLGASYNCTIENCSSNSTVFGTTRVGGLIGDCSRTTITNSHATGTVTDNTLYGYAFGGLVGDCNSHSFISNCYTTNSITGRQGVGGLIGWNSVSEISNSYSTSNVEGNYRVGGFIGSSHSHEIDNCYSTGMVVADSTAGGFIGAVSNSESIIYKSYSTGYVDCPDGWGFIGLDHDGAIEYNCFWDIETSGKTMSYGGMGRTTTEMKTMSTYTDFEWGFITQPWNDEDYWYIEPEHNDGYPFLTTLPLGVDDDEVNPQLEPNRITLSNYPNPFNPTTKIEFNLSHQGDVNISIFNIKGQKIKTLSDKRYTQGKHSVIWNGDDANNNAVSSGVYFYRFKSGSTDITKKMMLLK